MKTIAKSLPLLILITLSIHALAQADYKIRHNKFSVSGTSTLHEWESEVSQLEWNGAFVVSSNKIVDVKDVSVKIPVTAIKSTKGSIMDNKTYEAFKHEKYPFITFKLTAVKVSGTSKDFILDATGILTMAGISKNIALSAKASLLPNGDIQIISNKKLNMKDFGMTPPTAMFGSVKVGEEITVAFDLILAQNQNSF